MILKCDKTIIQKTLGKQGPSQCGVYAIAYGWSMLEGSCRVSGNPASHKAVANKYNPNSFDECYWANDGLNSHEASSIKDRYGSIMAQLKNKKPVIVAVGSSSGNHYVLVIGVKDGKTTDTVKPSDFYIIDPADAQIDYYGRTWADKNSFNSSSYGLQYCTFETNKQSAIGTATTTSTNTTLALRSNSLEWGTGDIKIAEAAAGENGLHGNAAGDQSGREVRIRNWSGGWTYVFRPKDINVAKIASSNMVAGCRNPAIGYDLDGRMTLYSEAEKVGWDLSKVTTKCETSCVDMVSVCLISAGLDTPKGWASGNVYSTLMQSKKFKGQFECYTSSDYTNSKKNLRPGDILVMVYGGGSGPTGHTAMAVDPDHSIELYTSGGGSIVGPQSISKLYSSENYDYVIDAKKNEEERQKRKVIKNKTSSFLRTIRDAISSFKYEDFNTSLSSYSLPEIVVNNSVKLAEFEREKPRNILKGKASKLLSYPTLVEAPTIILDFNGVKIGGYKNKGDIYPNYVTSMSVKKINGRVHQYTINLSYQIRPNEDPNFIDKLISNTGYRKPLKILYGDSSYNFYYREESAVILDVRQSEDPAAYKINYTIKAISSIGVASTSLTTFSKKTAKPSSIIFDLLYNSGEVSKNLIDLFPGMRDRTLVASKNLIPTDDKIVNIGGMKNASPLSYLSYLVACMNSNDTNSTYYLNLTDNSLSELGGSYFSINKVINYNKNDNIEINSNYFELDIGFPSNNFVTNFKICENNYWPLVYSYAEKIPKFEYGIDDTGNLTQTKTNPLFTGNKFSESSLIDSNWWNHVTEFPISAKVVIKGLLNSAMLMSYIKINAIFYGRRDMASGLYVVTAQEDFVSGSGCTTELTLLRVAGDT